MTDSTTATPEGVSATTTSRRSLRDFMLRTPLPARLALAGYRPRAIMRSSPAEGRPKVTVVVPCYNYGHYLRDCVNSALGQPGVDVEVIIIDDASTDNSADVARVIADTDDRVMLVPHERNAGHIATYNEGIAMATGEFIALASADDLLTPGALGRAAALMQRNPEVGLAYGCMISWRGGSLPPARTVGRQWAIWDGQEWLAQLCRVGVNPISPQAVMRTDVLRRVGGFRDELPHSADFMLWLSLAVVSDVGLVVSADQAYYRQHETSMSRTTYKGWLRDLQERVRTFDLLFADPPAPIRRQGDLQALARAALHREALGQALDGMLRGDLAESRAFRAIADELGATAGARLDSARNLGSVRRLSLQTQRRVSLRWRDLRYKRQRYVGVY